MKTLAFYSILALSLSFISCSHSYKKSDCGDSCKIEKSCCDTKKQAQCEKGQCNIAKGDVCKSCDDKEKCKDGKCNQAKKACKSCDDNKVCKAGSCNMKEKNCSGCDTKSKCKCQPKKA